MEWLCLCELSVLTFYSNNRSRYLYIVLGAYLHILVYPVFNPVVPYLYLLHTVCLYVADIANPDLFACGCWT